MLKRIKDFLLSKKGNMAILTIIIVPLILWCFTSVVSVTKRKTVEKQEVLISIDAFCEYVNGKYGKIYKRNGEDSCGFSDSGRAGIATYWEDYFTHIDGYNDKWTYEEITFGENDKGNTYYTIKCTVWFPKISDSMKVVEYWGTYTKTGGAQGEGYYMEHLNTIEKIYDIESEWTSQMIEVSATCL